MRKSGVRAVGFPQMAAYQRTAHSQVLERPTGQARTVNLKGSVCRKHDQQATRDRRGAGWRVSNSRVREKGISEGGTALRKGPEAGGPSTEGRRALCKIGMSTPTCNCAPEDPEMRLSTRRRRTQETKTAMRITGRGSGISGANAAMPKKWALRTPYGGAAESIQSEMLKVG